MNRQETGTPAGKSGVDMSTPVYPAATPLSIILTFKIFYTWDWGPGPL